MIEKAELHIRHKLEEAAENGITKQKFTYIDAPRPDAGNRLPAGVDSHASLLEILRKDFIVDVRRLPTPGRPLQGILVSI